MGYLSSWRPTPTFGAGQVLNQWGNYSPAPAAGGGYMTTPANALMSEVERQRLAANAANEARYGAIRGGGSDTQTANGGYMGLYDRGMDYLKQQTDQQYKDISGDWGQREAQGIQSLAARGMGNSTILNTMRAGYERGKQADLNRAKDAAMNRNLSWDQSLSKQGLDFMERREDVGPDLSMYAGLMQGAGQYGGGSGLLYGGRYMGGRSGLGAQVAQGGGGYGGYGEHYQGGPAYGAMPGAQPADQKYAYYNWMKNAGWM